MEVPSPTVPNLVRIASSPTVQLMIIPTFAVIRLFRARQGRWRHEKSESMKIYPDISALLVCVKIR